MPNLPAAKMRLNGFSVKSWPSLGPAAAKGGCVKHEELLAMTP